ncbi:MAG: hypothetical protein V4591_10760 [Bdellovibrionota bacterium]
MLQNIVATILVFLAVVYLVNKYTPRRKKALPLPESSLKSSSCKCGSSCPMGKPK